MPNSRGSRFQRARGSVRRQTEWSIGPSGSIVLNVAGATLFPTGAQSIEDAETIVRTRGEVNCAIDVSGALLEGFDEVAFGICVVSENAFGVGVTAVPSPISDKPWGGWLWYWTGSIFTVATVPTDAEGCAVVRIPIDSKAMRKIKRTDIMIGVAEALVETGTVQITCKMNTRVLLKVS